MDSVGLGQSWEEIKEESRSKMVCENCDRLEAENIKLEGVIIDKGFEILHYKTEIDALERRNDELEGELQSIKDDPSELLENYAGELD